MSTRHTGRACVRVEDPVSREPIATGCTATLATGWDDRLSDLAEHLAAAGGRIRT